MVEVEHMEGTQNANFCCFVWGKQSQKGKMSNSGFNTFHTDSDSHVHAKFG